MEVILDIPAASKFKITDCQLSDPLPCKGEVGYMYHTNFTMYDRSASCRITVTQSWELAVGAIT